ncbi:Low-affinity inorganic phosphate transporter 1 [Luteitalea pratensis]|uniref:Low-affinity inorganic phosphate transporter 1 n=1 Tax=Luteitalea pratensis TaxID=1855912 RepID=A0A143PML3_LUTPR|nr:inorganic phosphate transporter [Luteitalea pratensis]AMY09832.1 Low-affinity inorganic phosphate transporter 1 [Luteitalea pratensis]
MDSALLVVTALVILALAFDYINGFHDAANSIATVVSTRVLTPGQAVIWAAFFNFVAAFTFGTAVAKTVGSGMVDLKVVTFAVIGAGLTGAIVWNLITWYFGLPTSSSHALFGGYGGAAVAKAGLPAILWSGWTKTLVFIVVAPLVGMFVGLATMTATFWIFRRTSPARVDQLFRKLQLLSAALFSLMHGANDAQKTMGIITGVLFTAGYISTFDVPIWVVLAAHLAIGLGTLSGGWRIVRTMGTKITKLAPVGGFAAETGAAVAILIATVMGIGISTTHTITGSIVGVGATRRLSAVRWGVAGRIVWAWVLTIPAAAFVGASTYWVLSVFGAR